MPDPTHLEIIPLGGLGEFGMNLMVYRWGSDCLIVDAGTMFPGEDHLGIDVVIPDLSFLDDCGTLHGVVLTHGHEDHIGALPYLLARHDVPLHATPYTLGLIRNRLATHGMLSGRPLLDLPDDRRLGLGPFGVESLRASHSIPQARMLALRTPVGTILHTADFKFDPDPVDGVGTDLDGLARLGSEGVLALLADSTNADRPGRTDSERCAAAGIDALLADCRRKIIVTTFSSHIHRLQALIDLARAHDRHLALVGASVIAHAEVAEGLGLLRWPPGTRIAGDEIMRLEPSRVLVVVSGSQGEPLSALARIAVDKHRQVKIDAGDLVIHSAREIPGNQKSIARMINHLLRRGAEVVTAADAPVHVSGHASSDELTQLLELVQPRFFVPIHGEYRQLSAHTRLASAAGLEPERIVLADSGDVIAVNEREITTTGRVHVGQVFIDGTADEIDLTILRDRRRLAGDGIVVPVVAVHRESGAVSGFPQIMARGFVPITEDGEGKLVAEAGRVVADSIAEATPEERSDEGLLRARVQSELKRFLKRRTQRQPLIIPVILEL